MRTEDFRNIASTIPSQPGIYKYYDEKNELLYVGKAKNLRKRVTSYFNKTFTSYKTYELVQRIARIEFTVVNSEQDAFLLENNLIKQFQPRFNINLKDDKSYPYIVIKNESFPRVFLTRRKIDDGSEYLGPYTSVGKVRELLNFIKQTIQLRTCSLNLTEKNIQKGKFKVCLEYHLGNCKGPCENFQTKQEYDEGIVQVKNLLKGKLRPVIQHFKNEMKEYVTQMEFEKAELMRKKIQFLENYQAKSVVVNERLGDLDAFTIIKQNDLAFINYMMVQNGTIVQTKSLTVQSHLDESAAEILAFTIAQLRTTFASQAKEVIVPFEIEYEEENVTVIVPKGGEKKKLLELSQKNVAHFIEELKQKERLKLEAKYRDKSELLKQVQHDLHLSELPLHIECFDNSNFQGSYPVSAMVCFKNGEPSKKDYRHFNIKTVEGINDFASMKEAVGRRYRRVLAEDEHFPELVIIDGGKGQLNAATEALQELNVLGKTTVIGLAKNEEEIFFPGDKESLKLPYNSDSLKLIRKIRDEVHRFGINFHRQKRSKGTFKNELEDIKGIGKNTADTLLKKFRSVNNIKTKTEEELASVIGKSKAKIVVEYFLTGKNQEESGSGMVNSTGETSN
ncbi:MAG: excinuclease ABC subunit C [Chitinophagaceae bacterium]